MAKPVVLVVESDAQVRALLVQLLTEWGYRVDDTDSLEGLLDRLSSSDYSLAVAEYIEPGHPRRDSWPVLAALQHLAPQIPVVAIYADSPPKPDANLVGAVQLPDLEEPLRAMAHRHARKSIGAPANPRLALCLRSLWLGDPDGALITIRDALHQGIPVANVFDDLLATAMHQFGEWWGAGSCRIADEHHATSVVDEVIARMLFLVHRAPPIDRRAVLACVPAELHNLGLKMAAFVLRLEGWRVHMLGANTPESDILAFVGRTGPDLVAISATIPVDLSDLSQLIASLKQRAGTRVVLGGQAFSGMEQAQALGADGYSSRVSELMPLVHRLVGDQ